MKTRKTIGFAFALAFAAGVVWWLERQHDSTAGRLRVTAFGSRKQVGLLLCGDRNEIQVFSATGAIAASPAPMPPR